MKFRFGLLTLLTLVVVFAGPASLMRARFELERKYEADLVQKVLHQVPIPGLRVQSQVSLDWLFRWEGASVSIVVPRSYLLRFMSRPDPKQPINERELAEIYLRKKVDIEDAVILLLPPAPSGKDKYKPVMVVEWDDRFAEIEKHVSEQRSY